MAWTPSEPAAGSDGESVDIRAGWAAIERSHAQLNLVGDSSMEVWAGGDAVAPTMYELTGAGATIARAGTGLADTARYFGDFCAKVTAGGGAVGGLRQYVIPVGAFAPFDWLKGKSVSFGLALKCSTASSARGFISDGVANAFTDQHSGGGSFEWLTGTLVVSSGSPNQLVISQEIAAGIAAHVSGMAIVAGEIPPKYPVHSIVRRTMERFEVLGTLAVAGNTRRYNPRRPGILRHTQLGVKTAPTGADLICDIGVWNGGSLVSPYNSGSRPKVLATASYGGAAPDGTYSRRCLAPLYDTTRQAGDEVALFIDQIGSSVAGADLSVALTIDEYARPFDVFLAGSAYK